jgi:hypothetical protein
MSTTEDPTTGLEALLDDAMADAARRLNVSNLAIVEAYDAAAGTVRAQPVVRLPYIDEAGKRGTKRAPVVPAARVLWPAGGGLSLTFPLRRGDHVLLIYLDRSIAAWALTGREGDPEHDDAHDPAEAVAIPCCRPQPANWANSASIGVHNGPRLVFNSTKARYGEAAEPVATRRDLQVLFGAIQAATVVPHDGGASLKSALLTALAAAGWSPATADGHAGSTTFEVSR